jgi:membrane protease subunit HflK
VLPQARGEARRILLEADGYYDQTVQQARGEARRFAKMAAEATGPGRRLTAVRLILETMEEVLPRLNKVILDGEAGRQLDLGLFEEKP